MRHSLPLENRSSELRRRTASQRKRTSRGRSAPNRRKTQKVSLDFQYGQPKPDAIEPATLKTVNLEDLSNRIDRLEKEHSEMMAEHKIILGKTEGIEKTHSRIMKEHNFIMDKVVKAETNQMVEAKVQELIQVAKSKKGGATRRKRRIYK
jgi:uncharacterized protein (UPF0335 family)